MTIFSQQDSRWANVKMGGSNYTIGRWGCLLTDLTNLRNFIFGSAMRPDQADDKLSFTKDGLLIWGSLSGIGLKLVERVYKNDYNKILSVYKSSDKYAILQVNNNHWVWVIGRYIPYFGWKIGDPWTGTSCYTNKYRNNITGFAVISKG